jgi:CRISPR-associated protein Csm4
VEILEMKELKVFKFILKPESYFSEKLSSFTIFGALCWAVRFLYGEKELSRLIESVKKGEFLLSSAMPRIDGKDYVFKPILKPEHLKEEKIGITGESEFRNFIKKFKKLSFVSIDTLMDVANGRISDDNSLAEKVKNEVDKDFSPLFLQSLPHAKINRITNTTSEGGEFYFEESFFFMSEIYFLLAVEDEENAERVESALKLLQDWGIGGNRSIGFGCFSFRMERSKKFIETSLQLKLTLNLR